MNSSAVPPPIPAAEITLLLELAEDARNTGYATLSALIVVLFDHILTFEQEYHGFWKQPWSFTKGLFLWHRYVGVIVIAINAIFFVSYFPDAVCAKYFTWEGSSGILTIFNVETIMIYRAWALYGRKRWVLIFLSLLLAVELATTSVIMHYGLTHTGLLPRIGHLWSGCYPNAFPHFFSTFYVPPTIVTCIITMMTLYRSYSLIRGSSIRSPLTTIFFRDGLFYFFAIFSAYITNMVIWLVARPTMAQLAIGIVLAARIVVAARLLLNLKEAGGRTTTQISMSESVDYMPRWQTSRSKAATGTGRVESYELGQKVSIARPGDF